MKSALVILAVAATAFALPAAAQVNLSSVYVGGGVGRADQKQIDEQDTSWRIFGGYQINRNFAAELGYHHLGDAERGGVRREARAWELVGLGLFPVTNTLSAYGKLGLYHAQTELSAPGVSADDDNNGVTYGVGGQWDATRNIGARVEWQRYHNVGTGSTGEGHINVLSVNALYRFQ